MLTPEQQGLLNQSVSQLGPSFIQSMQGMMQPQTPQMMQDVFQKSYVDPAMQAYEQNILPSIQQRFVDANASSSSALNQALAQSASDLSTSLGSQYGSFLQGQQQNQLAALGQFLPLLTNQSFSPMIQQRQGILGPLIGAAGTIGAGMAMSSKKVKENIRDYESGTELIKDFEVKQYDYIEEVGGMKDRIGLMAEDLPPELTATKDGVLHVDLYGLIAVLINAVKELNERVQNLEEAL